MSGKYVWLQLSELDGVAQSEIERIAACAGTEVVRQLREEQEATVVLGEPLRCEFADNMARILTGAEFRRRYGLGLYPDERVEAIRRCADGSAPSYAVFVAMLSLVMGANTETERESAARFANEVLSVLEPHEMDVCGIDDAIQGRAGVATLGVTLTLTGSEADLARARWLGSAPTHLPNVERINLYAKSLDQAAAVLEALGSREIACLKLPSLPAKDLLALLSMLPANVRGVDARDCRGGPAMCSAIAQSQAWPTLRQLKLYNAGGDSRGLKLLAATEPSTKLEVLDIGLNHLRANDFAALAKASWLPQLRSLSMKFNAAGERGARALFLETDFTQLRALDFGGNEIGDGGVAALVSNATIRSLESLSLEGNRAAPLIGPDGARSIAQWSAARSITTLDLSANKIGDDGLVALVTSPHLARVRSLNVRQNGITANAICELSGRPTEMRPKRVVLMGNRLGQDSSLQGERVADLWTNAYWLSECEHLALDYTDVDRDAFASLLASNSLPALRSLHVSSSRSLSNDALIMLVESPLAEQLTALDVSDWSWSAGAAEHLLRGSLARQLVRLSLAASGLTSGEVTALRATYGGRLVLC